MILANQSFFAIFSKTLRPGKMELLMIKMCMGKGSWYEYQAQSEDNAAPWATQVTTVTAVDTEIPHG